MIKESDIIPKLIVPDEFIERPAWHRLEDQYRYYNNSSGWNKKWHLLLKLAQLIFAAAIPILSLIPSNSYSQWVVAVLAGLIAISEGVQQLFRFTENWIKYRSTAEQLLHEKFLLLSFTGPYRGLSPQESFSLLAERIEALISKEHSEWAAVVRDSNKRVNATNNSTGQGK